MKLSSLQIEPEPLAALAVEATKLLAAGKYSELAGRLGYAVALGRDPATAIEEDLRSSLTELEDTQVDLSADPETRVKYFKPNDDKLYAVAECVLATRGGRGVLIELVVFGSGNEFHATLEQVSAAA